MNRAWMKFWLCASLLALTVSAGAVSQKQKGDQGKNELTRASIQPGRDKIVAVEKLLNDHLRPDDEFRRQHDVRHIVEVEFSVDSPVARYQLVERYRSLRHALFSIFEACQRQNPADELVQPAGLQLNPIQHVGTFHSRTLTRQSQSYIQSRQRRTQFVRDVVQQARLRLD